MDNTVGRLWNFVRYKSDVTPMEFGTFVAEATANPDRFKQGRYAVNCALDRTPLDTLLSLVQQHDLKHTCVFMTGDPDLVAAHRDANFRYFPYFIAEGISQVRAQNELENPIVDFQSRDIVMSCVNRIARPHRLYLYYLLCQQPNLQQAAFSFTRLCHKFDLVEQEWTIGDYSLTEMIALARQWQFASPEFESWLTTEFSNLPRQIETMDTVDNKYVNWLQSRAFTGSYANLVTETELEGFVPTEKVVKPLLAGCLFMVMGSPGFVQNLTRMGFDLAFEGIDHQRYDQLVSWHQRARAVADLANEIYPNIPQLWLQNIDKLQYNRNLFFSQQLADHVIDDVLDIFDPVG